MTIPQLRPQSPANGPAVWASAAPIIDSEILKIGAGEGIRTLDPDLGKVVLYP
jgi:hypothetical protein